MQSFIYGFGKKQLSELLSEYNIKKYMLVCDGALDFLPVKTVFREVGTPFVKFSDFTPNPLYEDVVKGVELFASSGCDGIIAVGGGSTIDVAKCIKLYSAMDSSKCYIGQEFSDSKIPLVAMPTTAGTGSESTRHAVIYYKGEKQSISHDSIVPNTAVLDASVLKTLPLYQKKCTMLDALCQGIESLWSVNSNDESLAYSEKAISLIFSNADGYIFENDSSAAEKIMEGANLSGRAINITQTTAAHAMSYKMSSLYGIPHGHAVAIGLGKVWEYMLENSADCIDPRGEERLLSAFDKIAKAMGRSTPAEALASYESLLDRLEIKAPESKESDLEILVPSVNPVRLKNNPVRLTENVLEALYRRILNL